MVFVGSAAGFFFRFLALLSERVFFLLFLPFFKTFSFLFCSVSLDFSSFLLKCMV